MGKIIVKGLRVFAYHGVNAEEKYDGQHFIIDLTASVDSPVTHANDNIDDMISYAKMIKTVVRVMTEQPYDLLERIAQRVAGQTFQEYPMVVGLEVLFMKPEASVQVEFEYTAVSTIRRRSDFG